MATVKKEGERINQFITAPEVRVVHDERGSLGVMSIKDALALAKEEGSDLVEIVLLFVRLSIMVSINLIFRRRVKKLRKSKS